MSTEKYTEDSKMSTFIVDWTLISATGIVLFLSAYIVFCLTLHVLFEEGFVAKDYLLRKVSSIDMIGLFLVSFYIFFSSGRKFYRLIKENPFASIDNKGLVLYFGKDFFLWEHVREVVIEGERKLTIVFTEEGKQRKKVNDLKRLAEKDDFIRSLKRTCSEKRISYRESEMTLSSRVGLILRMMKRSLFEPSPERK